MEVNIPFPNPYADQAMNNVTFLSSVKAACVIIGHPAVVVHDSS